MFFLFCKGAQARSVGGEAMLCTQDDYATRVGNEKSYSATKKAHQGAPSIKKQGLPTANQKEYEHFARTPFHTPCSQGIVCYTS